MAFFLLILLAAPVSGEDPTFLRGTKNGCWQKASEDWVPITEPRLPCPPRTVLRTDEKAWGTAFFAFGSVMIHPGSELRFEPQGMLLTRGSFRAFITASPGAFRFRQPQATLCVRGTVFSADASGTVGVTAGAVGLIGIDGNETRLTPETSPTAKPSGDLPDALEQLEGALEADHDGKAALAVERFVKALNNPALAGLPEYRTRLLDQCLQNLARSNPPPAPAIVAEVGKLVGALGEAWYATMQRLLEQGRTQDVQALLKLAPIVKPFDPENPRDRIIRSLAADASGNLKELETSVQELGNEGSSITPRPEVSGFWQDSEDYLRMLRFPKSVKPEMTTRLLQPATMKTLAPTVARKRMAAINSLPRDLLEAKGLFQLIRAYLAGGQWDGANETLSYFARNYPGSPLLQQAKKLVADYDRAAKATRKRGKRPATASVRLPRPSGGTVSVASEAVSAIESGRGETAATGSLASATAAPESTEGASAESLGDGF